MMTDCGLFDKRFSPVVSSVAVSLLLIIHNDIRYLSSFVMMKILGITAHPDDEAGAFGGSLLRYHDRGIETYVICLTPGQAATNRGGARSDEELASLRRAEFFASCDILKVTGAWVLDYTDGGLDRMDFPAVVGDLVRRVRTIKPHVILTLGTEGAITGHPDHAMASLFATMAFHWAARKDRYPEQLADGSAPHQTQKLYYCTAPFTLPDRPPVSPAPCTAAIDIRAFLKDKERAFRAHKTQIPLADKFSSAGRRFGGMEYFHLAAVNRPSEMQKEDDLLTGVIE
ncbi:MAG TPA: PIG-L family deacetylase [Acidobacteriota bacterium]|nr:PIG-L family deacetylase [Acidobacteriota bacterium]